MSLQGLKNIKLPTRDSLKELSRHELEEATCEMLCHLVEGMRIMDRSETVMDWLTTSCEMLGEALAKARPEIHKEVMELCLQARKMKNLD